MMRLPPLYVLKMRIAAKKVNSRAAKVQKHTGPAPSGPARRLYRAMRSYPRLNMTSASYFLISLIQLSPTGTFCWQQ